MILHGYSFRGQGVGSRDLKFSTLVLERKKTGSNGKQKEKEEGPQSAKSLTSWRSQLTLFFMGTFALCEYAHSLMEHFLNICCLSWCWDTIENTWQNLLDSWSTFVKRRHSNLGKWTWRSTEIQRTMADCRTLTYYVDTDQFWGKE